LQGHNAKQSYNNGCANVDTFLSSHSRPTYQSYRPALLVSNIRY